MNALRIKFPSDTERILQDVADARDLTAEQRLTSLLGLLEFIDSFESGRQALRHDPFQDQLEADWQRRMHDFIRQQLGRQAG